MCIRDRSYSLKGPQNISGISNYLLQVKSKLNTSIAFHPAINLWVFDSHQEGCGSIVNSYGCIDSSQIQWYEETSRSLEMMHGNSKNTVHTAFFHIPLQSLWRCGMTKLSRGRRMSLLPVPKQEQDCSRRSGSEKTFLPSSWDTTT
eukprot:TRINITY_DN12761_c0_g1_i2.p3 TRINITY_DN12761_c0_g1~~TRINITY_DN12761_c0_g1_i2.p3  ORF type:complete len:146 (+),score=15.85 TRINITY_DN12761_c0_g1_i2:66-503(+)